MRFRIRDRALRLFGPLREHPAKVRRARNRVLEGAREVGVLLIAFAPLDAVLIESQGLGARCCFFLCSAASCS